MRSDVGVGELRPTPHTRHDDAARRHWVEDTFHEGGVELCEVSVLHGEDYSWVVQGLVEVGAG